MTLRSRSRPAQATPQNPDTIKPRCRDCRQRDHHNSDGELDRFDNARSKQGSQDDKTELPGLGEQEGDTRGRAMIHPQNSSGQIEDYDLDYNDRQDMHQYFRSMSAQYTRIYRQSHGYKEEPY